MADNTAIEWCDATLNLWWGCTKVSEGCKHCYADTWSKRYGKAVWGPKGTRVEVKTWRSTLNKISERAKREGRRLRVFCQSMSDTFEGPETMGGVDSENWAVTCRLRLDLMTAIQDHPELDFLLLTKRPENAASYFGARASDKTGILHHCRNIWIGTSVEDQRTADERIPHLERIPAAVRFLSCEPLIGDVDLGPWLGDCIDCDEWINTHRERGAVNHYCEGHHSPCIDWVICGGESGPNARPMRPEWARSLRDQCQAAGVPFLFKQWGEFAPGFMNAPPDAQGLRRVGKKRAGRLLDGREWSEFPEVLTP